MPPLKLRIKDEITMLTALVTIWFSLYGGPSMLVVDGEAALGAEYASQILDHWGIF